MIKEKTRVYGYIRRSTEDNKQGDTKKQLNSIAAQTKEIKRLAELYDVEIVQTFVDKKTGTKAYIREGFNKMIRLLETKGDINGVIMTEISRIGRNYGDAGSFMWLLQNGDITDVYTSERVYTATSSDQLLMLIMFAIAKYESDENSYRVKLAKEEKISDGIPPYRAIWGYKTVGIKGKKRWVIKEKEVKEVIRMFKLFSEGRYTRTQLGEIIYAEGITNRQTGKKLSNNTIGNRLKNITYTGRFTTPD